MRKELLIAAIAVTGMVAFAACRKESKTTTAIPRLNNAKDFVNKYGPGLQVFTVDVASLPRTITLLGGTKVTIPGGITVNGQPVNGSITVEAIEVLKRSDILFSGTNTNTSDGRLLQSKGFIYVNVKSNGRNADNYLTSPMHVVIAAPEGDSTLLWRGDTSVNGSNQLGWSPRNGGSIKAGPTGFEFDFSNLGWINCDVYWGIDLPKTTMHVSLTNNPGSFATFYGTTGNTYVFLCLSGTNVAAQLYTLDGTGVKSYDNTIPIGVTARILAFSIKDGHYYVAQKDVVTAANETDVLTLTETTADAIQADIDALNTY